jgi:hypothetical protein
MNEEKEKIRFKISRPSSGIYKLELSQEENALAMNVDFTKRRVDILYQGKDDKGRDLLQTIGLEFGGAFSLETKETYPYLKEPYSLVLPQTKKPFMGRSKYISRLKSLITENNLIREEDIDKNFTPEQKPGIKKFLNNLVKSGYAQKTNGDYKILDFRILEKARVAALPRTTKYLERLKQAIENEIIREEKVDEIFTTPNERKGVKQVLVHLSKKGVVELISQPYEKFRYRIKPEFGKLYDQLYNI